MKHTAATTTLLLIATPALAHAQSSPPATRPAQREAPAIDPATGRPVEEPPPPTPMASAEDAAARMYLGGRSLLQAQLESRRSDPFAETGIDPNVSFFAVPEPEPTVIRKHDLVTVIVREESTARSSGNTKLEKETGLDAALLDYVRLDLRSLDLESRNANARLRAEAEADFEGKGSVDRRDSFVARITAEVLDVKPNGTLVLQARKRITNDDEEQVFILTGTCRTQDITADNSVLSTQLHDLNLEKHTTGAVRDATKRGLIPRLLGKLNPF